MPYQLRNRTRVGKTESVLPSTASSATLEHNEDAADETPLNKGSGTNRLKRGLCGSAGEGAGETNVISEKGLPPQKRKRTERTDMVNNTTLRTSIIIKNLDMLYKGLQRSQRMSVAILGLIKSQHNTLVFESFIERQPKTLPVAQTRRLFEQRFWDIENQVHTLVADLEEDIWTQQCRVGGIKRFIQQNGGEGAREGASTADASLVGGKADRQGQADDER